MKVLRVFNNNVVLAANGSQEVIVTGRGLGFKAKPGQEIDDAKVVRVFVPSDGRDPDHLAELLAGIPPEMIRLVTDAMTRVGLGQQAESKPTLVMALADHVTGAVQRFKRGEHVAYPLAAEVQSLYPAEYAQAERILAQLNAELNHALPDSEAVAFTLHLVNAGFSNGDLSYTYQMTGIIQQMIAVIERCYGIELDQHSINVGRFITHLRYLFVRIRQHQQLDREPEPIITSIEQSYPEAMSCARAVADIVRIRLDSPLTGDEIAYLALHIARVTSDAKEERRAARADETAH
ncbi:PRD domain-containing protein [Bifidobacterium amazonense]|uniref:PRD domain-containing protein n=1 Tax=Bifidobacterium amazonense TaxID=2809027 RepID=A0ABS9VYV4_9BIFI|nr:PRD domain-containing protein [Bifidobacterium amazonense]MCH9276995.1 PRD domain-containing protein [Bifidobacterium amazonense]